jgi:hypothetical protein
VEKLLRVVVVIGVTADARHRLDFDVTSRENEFAIKKNTFDLFVLLL